MKVLSIVLMFVSFCASAQLHLEDASLDNVLSTLSDDNLFLKKSVFFKNIVIKKDQLYINNKVYRIDKYTVDIQGNKTVKIEAGAGFCSVLIIFPSRLTAVAAIVKEGSNKERFFFNQSFFSNE